MGNSYSTPSPTPPSLKPPKGRRVHIASVIAEDMIKLVNEQVIKDPSYLGKERECYEVSAQMHEKRNSMLRIVHDNLPGSQLPRSKVARNRVTLAEKIVAVVQMHIDVRIIRPGPTPEDRSSFDMADELWLEQTPLTELIAAVIQVEDEYEGLVPKS